MLDAMLSNRQSGMHIRRIAPGSVTERESTRLVLCEDEQVANALRLIKARATSGLTASDVASEATICRRALEMRFRQFRKHTIWEEITFEKLEQACPIAESLECNHLADQRTVRFRFSPSVLQLVQACL